MIGEYLRFFVNNEGTFVSVDDLVLLWLELGRDGDQIGTLLQRLAIVEVHDAEG